MEKAFAWSYTMGHAIECVIEKEDVLWRYTDTKESAALKQNNRKCVKCNRHATSKGHDPCIVNLPDVEFACCGHGVEYGYVKFRSGKIVDFEKNSENEINEYCRLWKGGK